MTDISEFTGRVIRELRGGTSQTDLAKALNVATNTVSRWETGTYEPSLDSLWKMSRYFRVPVSRFFPKNEKKTSLNVVSVICLCDSCLGGAAGVCSTPGCALWQTNAPGRPIRDVILRHGGTIDPLLE